MDAIVNSVRIKYNERRISVEQKQPWSRESNGLVRLQLVNKKKEFSSSTNARRGEDKKSTPLAYGDLFKAESGERPVRKVLVEGGAGIGKTTLTVSLSEDWACKKLFQKFELLLLLPLRHEKIALAHSLPKLLEFFHSDEEVRISVDSYLKKKEGEKVLVIADGWDELSKSQRSKDSFFYKLFFVDFPLMSVVVTSRPSASAPLHNLACIDRFVEIKGFNENDIKEYIQSEFATDQEKAQRLLEQLEYNPLIESVCRIPLNCAIACHLWHTLKEKFPSTMTQLYEKIILLFVCRNLRKLQAYGPTFSMANFNDLPEGLQKSWWLLCEFAFKALEKDQIVFSKQQLPEISKEGGEQVFCFGLLQTVETVLASTSEVSYNFLHLTFMEYLAALHLSKQPLDSNWFVLFERFDMFARFFFGIRFCVLKSGADISDVKQIINSKDVVIEGLSLCHCVFEAQNATVNSVVQFDGYLGDTENPHDCAALLYVIANMQECSNLAISFEDSGVRENQIKQLADVLASKHGKLQVGVLNLSGNKLTDKIVSYLFNKTSVAFQSLTDLDLHDNKIGAESIKSITTAPSSSGCTLSNLDLSSNLLEVSGLQALDNALREGVLSKLQCLFMSGSLTSDADSNALCLISFVEALSAHCPHLIELDLSRNRLGVPQATALARGISRLQQSHSANDSGLILYLNQTNIGDEGLSAFVNSVEGVCRFRWLCLRGNDIHATGVSCLADAVCSEKIVIRNGLYLRDNVLGHEGALAVGRILSSNPDCQLDCLECELTTAGGGLPNTDPLNLGSNISSETVKQELCQMPQNNTVSLSTNNYGITSDGHIQLLKTLESSFCDSNLRSWHLDNNQISDDEVSTLTDHLRSPLPKIHLDDNQFISELSESESTSSSAGGHLSSPASLSQSSLKSSSDDHIKGTKDSLSMSHPPQRPHHLTTSQSTEEPIVDQKGK